MMQNYLAAWERKYPDCFLVLFVDHTSHLTVPVASPDNLTDDHDMVIHLDHFYRMIKIQGGILQALLPKVRLRVDIIEASKFSRALLD